ncbi:hypothetical protein [Thermostaphylospora chromogena]|uniref:hypothetical protein n=1 Tax=Thermostaphylospora chromogena TaxID=35622 RepID=UPI001041E822|nr:hypothetical protein [Thermostaphylospora chromogena]
MTLPEIAQAVMPDPRIPEFVISDFLQSRDTLYLVASAEAGSPVPPLLCALLAELKHEAVLLGHGCRRAGSTRRCPWSSTRSPT